MLFPWKAEVSIKGITPLIIHNGRAASPLDVYSKKMKSITGLRKKTEEDIRKLMMIQWEAGLYWDDKIGLHLPVENIMAALHKACKKHKMGPNVGGFIFDELIGFPIITPNHKNLAKLAKDDSNKFTKLVTVQRAKVLSCRPIFSDWAINFEFSIDEDMLNVDTIRMILTTLSRRIGIGVWTPSNQKPGNFGKFLIKKLDIKNMDTGETKNYDNDLM